MNYIIDEQGYVYPKGQEPPTKECPKCGGEMRERTETQYSELKTRNNGLSPYAEIEEKDIWSCRCCDYSESRNG